MLAWSPMAKHKVDRLGFPGTSAQHGVINMVGHCCGLFVDLALAPAANVSTSPGFERPIWGAAPPPPPLLFFLCLL